MYKIRNMAIIVFCLAISSSACGDESFEQAYHRLTFQPRMSLQCAFPDDTGIIHNIQFFGAKGDGRHDDTQSIKNAIKRTNKGDTVFFPPGKYLVTSPIILHKSGITIKGSNAEIIFRPVESKGWSFRSLNSGKNCSREIPSSVFLVMGNLEVAGYELCGYGLKNTSRLELCTPIDILSKGDLVVIESSDHGELVKLRDKEVYLDREQNFISSIDSVEGSVIVIADPMPFPLEVENNPMVFIIKPIANVKILDLSITIAPAKPDVADVSGITMAYAVGTIIRNITVRHALKESVNLQHCYQCEISQCRLIDMFRRASTNGLGVNLDRSHFCLIRNNFIANCRHGVLLNHGNSNCVVENNRIEKVTSIAAIDLHGEFNSYNVIRQNYISKCKAGIVLGGGGEKHYNDGPFNALTGNQITDCDIGIQIKNKTPSTIIGTNRFDNFKYEEKQFMRIDTSSDQIIRIEKE